MSAPTEIAYGFPGRRAAPRAGAARSTKERLNLRLMQKWVPLAHFWNPPWPLRWDLARLDDWARSRRGMLPRAVAHWQRTVFGLGLRSNQKCPVAQPNQGGSGRTLLPNHPHSMKPMDALREEPMWKSKAAQHALVMGGSVAVPRIHPPTGHFLDSNDDRRSSHIPTPFQPQLFQRRWLGGCSSTRGCYHHLRWIAVGRASWRYGRNN